MDKKINCHYCNSEFNAKSNRARFCSIQCRDNQKFEDNQKELLKGQEGWDYVIDQWNGYVTTRIYGKWFKKMHPNSTIEDYKAQFPNAKLQCDRINQKNGKHMKRPEMKEWASNRVKGQNNPNHSNNTTKEQRKSKSPFSKNFKYYNSEEERQQFIQSVNYESRITNTHIKWWIDYCNGDVEKAKEMLKERQRTFTLNKYTEKFGQEEGRKIFEERKDKWSKKIEKKYKNGEFTRFCMSNVSQKELDFIKHLVNKLNLNTNDYLSDYNGKQFFRHFKEIGQTFSFDFKMNNKIIEFHGDYWHMNPKFYDKNKYNPLLEMKAQEKWEFDKWKKELIESHGYKVLEIWENEYDNYPEETIQKCIKFLKRE
jgi:very-short-patch-repair endonuclease